MGDLVPSILNRSAGISLDTFLALIIRSQKVSVETALPGNFMFMPIMAMGVVLSLDIFAICVSLSANASEL